MTITRYEPQWVGTDPKRLMAVVESTQGICRVTLVNSLDRELVPRQFFGCTGMANYTSDPISQMTAGMGGMNVRVLIQECNDSPTEVEDCRRGGPPGPVDPRASPPIGPTPGPMMPLMCSPRGMMLDVCTSECMARLAPIRGTRQAVVDACNAARAQQRTATELGVASTTLLLAAGFVAFAASRASDRFTAIVLGVLGAILLVAALILLAAMFVFQALADERWRDLSAAQTAWQESTRGVLTVCCPECVGELLSPHPCPR